jgi:hypothetical protein
MIVSRTNPQRQLLAQMGLDSREKFKYAAADAIRMDAGVSISKPAPGTTELRGLPLINLARKSLSVQRIEAHSDNYVMSGRAMSSDDFDWILSDVVNKMLNEGFENTWETWGTWVNIGELSDFRAAKIAQFETDGLEELEGERHEFPYGKITDTGETAQLLTFGKIFEITRRVLMTNDKALLTSIPRQIGATASRKIGDLVYAILTGNAAMSDGVTLFHANHLNVGTGGAPADATVGEAIKLMKQQTLVGDTAPANIPPQFFVGPVALEATAENAFRSIQGDTNKIKRIYDARLDSTSETGWYMTGPTGKTVTVFGLDGNVKPTIESEENWQSDSIDYRCRLDAVATAVDWRAMVYNAGA